MTLASVPRRPAPRGAWWRNRLLRWLAALAVVVLLVLVTVTVLLGTARAQQSDDPRSHTPSGTGALTQLLSDEGVALTTVDRVDAATGRVDARTTLVVANADRLTTAESRRLMTTPHARLVLLRPSLIALHDFGVDATTVGPASGTLPPACPDPLAQRAGTIVTRDLRASYRAGSGPAELVCYPSGDGYAWLRLRTGDGLVDVVAGGLANDVLGQAGNASFATALLGSQPQVVWLMTPRPSAPGGGAGPTLLPRWWEMAVVQTFLALVVVAVWRGRRLGPIMVEALPVTVRAAETVEGHGRLYYRLGARDRAAAVLRSAARDRLGRSFGHTDDPESLSTVVAGRTGHDSRAVHQLLTGPPPATDEALMHLVHDLDQLEQEASRP